MPSPGCVTTGQLNEINKHNIYNVPFGTRLEAIPKRKRWSVLWPDWDVFIYPFQIDRKTNQYTKESVNPHLARTLSILCKIINFYTLGSGTKLHITTLDSRPELQIRCFAQSNTHYTLSFVTRPFNTENSCRVQF